MYEDYLKILALRNHYSLNTIIAYRCDLRQFEFFLSQQKSDFCSVDEHLIRLYITKLSTSVSKISLARKITCLRSFYNYLIENNYIERNYFSLLGPMHLAKKLPEVLFFNEIEPLLDYYDPSKLEPIRYRDNLIVELLFGCGLRLTELVNLKLSDFNFDINVVKVFGKNRKERLIGLNEVLLEKLEVYLSKYYPLLNTDNLPYVFISKLHKQLSPRYIEMMLNQLEVKLNFNKHLHPHLFRHSFATCLLENGASIIQIQQLLGHKRLSTSQIYSHLSLTKLQQQYKQLYPY
jgi:site-specific recombinase XerD